MTVLSLGLACLGCVLLSLSLKRHYKQALPEHIAVFEQRYVLLRSAGYLCVGLSLIPSVLAAGLWIGVVLWLSLLALAALAQALVLTYRPHYSARFGMLSLVMILWGLIL